MSTLVEKAAELGVAEVVLVASERARRLPDEETVARRLERLRRVCESAARQAGRAGLTRCRGLIPFASVIAEIPHGEGFLLDPEGDVPLARALGWAPARLSLVVGPDAGFSREEVAAGRAAGLRVAGLGPAVLRAETAGIVGASLALAAMGALDTPA
jgi:16S rRNA (uracil1498-N3)-methyltransferase